MSTKSRITKINKNNIITMMIWYICIPVAVYRYDNNCVHNKNQILRTQVKGNIFVAATCFWQICSIRLNLQVSIIVFYSNKHHIQLLFYYAGTEYDLTYHVQLNMIINITPLTDQDTVQYVSYCVQCTLYEIRQNTIA